MVGQARIAEIDLAAFCHNRATLKEKAQGRGLMLCLKAGAYGHSTQALLPALSEFDCCWVATLEEGIQLRTMGYAGGIVVNTTPVSDEVLHQCITYDLAWVLFSESQLATLEAFESDVPVNVWVKCNTGMNRLGVDYRCAYQVIKTLQGMKTIALQGMISHLANAGELNHPITVQQVARFSALAKQLPGVPTSLYNSAGLLLHKEGFMDDWVRPGLALYGASNIHGCIGSDFGLQPVMTLKGQVIVINEVACGESVGYDSVWQAEHATQIAVIGLGYADGYPRYAPSGTPVLINGSMYPLVGRVSMDVITVDVGMGSGIVVGDWAIAWGRGLPIETIAKAAGTTAHTLLAQVGHRVKRIAIGEAKMEQMEKKRLYWQCRRGLLELDAMLLPFYEDCFHDLSEADQVQFARLLQHSDPQLQAWLVNREPCEDSDLAALIHQIVQADPVFG